jgi:hypothetical protein
MHLKDKRGVGWLVTHHIAANTIENAARAERFLLKSCILIITTSAVLLCVLS